MNESIDTKLKNFYNMVSSKFGKLGAVGDRSRKWFLNAPREYLSEHWILLKYEINNGQRVEVPNAAFLNSDEFNSLPWEKKALSLREISRSFRLSGPSYGLRLSDNNPEILGTDDYFDLIQRHKTDWNPYVKFLSLNLISRGNPIHISPDDLDKLGFSDWLYEDQLCLICGKGLDWRAVLHFKDGFKNDTLDDLMGSPFFDELSPVVKGHFCNYLFRDNHYDPNADLKQLPILTQLLIWMEWHKERNFNIERYSEPIEFLHRTAYPHFEDIQKKSWYKDLSPDEKIIFLLHSKGDSTAEKLKCLGSIPDLDKLQFQSVPVSGRNSYTANNIYPNAIEAFFQRFGDDLGPGLILNSNWPLNVKLAAYGAIPYGAIAMDSINREAYLSLIVYPTGVSLNFQKLYENLSSTKENKDDLIEDDLKQIEFMTREYVTAAIELLNLEKAKVDELKSLLENLDTDVNKIKMLVKIWRIILNVLELPFFFTDWGKDARAWFTNPKLQIIKNRLEHINEKANIFPKQDPRSQNGKSSLGE